MLVDTLNQIVFPLTRSEFLSILANLIDYSCEDKTTNLITMKPYNELLQTLDQDYTMYAIRNLAKETYTPEEIQGFLGHLYRYTVFASRDFISSLTIQPQVLLKEKPNGEHYYTYEQHHLYKYIPEITLINDISYIRTQLEFVPAICECKEDNTEDFLHDMELLFSYDKCDQYLAFNTMIKSNEIASGSSSSSTLKYSSGKRRIPSADRTSRDIFSKPYWLGYFFYGIPKTPLPSNANTIFPTTSKYLFENKV